MCQVGVIISGRQAERLPNTICAGVGVEMMIQMQN